jgi:hypothetical protein
LNTGENKDEELIFNFEFLRQHGIELLQQLSGNIWTDYNLHDPGVTILEHLCFVFTDLAYRTDFSIQDILATENGNIEALPNSFFTPREILSINPVTLQDKRKYIIDSVPEIANILIEPVVAQGTGHTCFAGVYKTVVQLKKDYDPELNNAAGTGNDTVLADTGVIKQTVKDKLIASRNLCEDFEAITILKPEHIAINAGIIIESDVLGEEVLARIYIKLEALISSEVKYATEKELKNKGLPIEEIYHGPRLEKGIITDDELKPIQVIIDPVAFIKTILSVDGVVNIRNFQLKVGENAAGANTYHIREGYYPYLEYKQGNVSLYKNNTRLEVRESVFKNRYYRIKQVTNKDFIAALYRNEDALVLQGKWRDLKKYYSIQQYFPHAYGLGKYGVPDNANAERKAAVKQLRGYLMLFEQTLLNYLAQLGNISNFFSADLQSPDARSTIYCQSPFDLPGANDIIKSLAANAPASPEAEHNLFMEKLRDMVESDEAFLKKKNGVFDHLLARFNLSLADTPVVKYEKYYCKGNDQRTDLKLRWKSSLLLQIKEISYYKFRAFDYAARDNTLPQNAGFKKNMYSFLHIAGPYEKSLTAAFNNGHFRLIPPAGRREAAIVEPTIHSVQFGAGDTGTHELIDDQLNLLSSSGEPVNETVLLSSSFFNNQTIAVFSSGVNNQHYKLLADPVNPERVVLAFKVRNNGNRDTWRIISRHTHHAQAERLLSILVQYFRRISIASEGFHMVEHILLRPGLDDPVFKHVLVDNTGRKILWQKELTGFAQSRQQVDACMQQIAAGNVTPTLPELRELFAGWDAVVEYKNADNLKYYASVAADETVLRHAFDMLRAAGTANNIRCMVKYSAGLYADTIFFSNKISFVFPLWPARFQDAVFKTYAQNFIAAACPVYVRPHFLWLNIGRMNDFEAVYFQWFETLKGTDTALKKQLNAVMVQLIAHEKYIVRTNADDE